MNTSEHGYDAITKLILDANKARLDPACIGSTALPPLPWNEEFDDNPSFSPTPLAHASMFGHESVVKLLLQSSGADSNCQDGFLKRTPLSWAAEYGHSGIVGLFLEPSRANVNSKDDIGFTPLLYAAARGHDSIVDLLLKSGAPKSISFS